MRAVVVLTALCTPLRAQFPSPIDITNLSGVEALVIEGYQDVFLLGGSVAPLGDVNGDGIDDFAVSATDFAQGGQNSLGAVFVVFGDSGLWSLGTLGLAQLDGTNGFLVRGGSANKLIGSDVAGIDDVNGDGYDDFLIGAKLAVGTLGIRGGQAFVVFGGPTVGAGGLLDLATLDGTNGFSMNGLIEEEGLGTAVCGAGDLNQDGLADFALGAPGAGAPSTVLPIANTDPGESASADLDGDGDVDFAVTFPGFNRLDLFFALGGGVFANQSYPLSGFAEEIELVDLGGDGKPDVVMASNDAPSRVIVMMNVSSGLLGPEVVYALPEDRCGIEVGDMDGDGDRDVVATSYEPSSGPGLHQVFVLKNNGSGTLTVGPPVNVGVRPTVFKLAKVDGDADLDVIVYEQLDTQISVLLNSGTGTLSLVSGVQQTGSWQTMAVGDIDGDGDQDVSGGLQILKNQGGSFGSSVVIPFNHTVEAVELVDIDLDGDKDLLAGCDSTENTGQFAVFPNDGSGGFGWPMVYCIPVKGVADFELADLDGDLDLDVFAALGQPLLQTSPRGQVGTLFNVGSGRFQGALAGAAYVVFGAPGIGAPGELDLTALDGTNGFVIPGSSGNCLLGTAVHGPGDFDQDGVADLFLSAPGAHVGGAGSGAVYFLRGGAGIGAGGTFALGSLNGSNGFTLFGAPFVYGLDRPWFAGRSLAGGGDVNGDGRPDLLVGVRGAMNPNEGFIGEADVVFGAPGLGSSGSISLLNLDGENGFRLQGASKDDEVGAQVACGDINGDGFGELVSAGPFADVPSSNVGHAYSVYGADALQVQGTTLALGALDGARGFRLQGHESNQFVGTDVAVVGDIDGDGIDELLVGATGVKYPGFGDRRGKAYLIRGQLAPTGSQVYCTAKVNSQGCTPQIGASGTPSASAGSGFVVSASSVINNKLGIAFFGTTGPASTPFQGAFLCIGSPVQRTPPVLSGGSPPPATDCTGVLSFDYNVLIASGSNPALFASQHVWTQFWYRDPPAPFSTGLTDAVHFVIAP